MPYIGTSPSQGVRRVHTYTATANQTTFTGAGAEGATLSYKDSNFVDVYQNGVKLGDADYTATSGTSIVLGTGATVSDLVVIVAYDVFSAADTVSKADGGQFDGNIVMAGTVSVTGTSTLTGNVAASTCCVITAGADGNAAPAATTNFVINRCDLLLNVIRPPQQYMESMARKVAAGEMMLDLNNYTTYRDTLQPAIKLQTINIPSFVSRAKAVMCVPRLVQNPAYTINGATDRNVRGQWGPGNTNNNGVWDGGLENYRWQVGEKYYPNQPVELDQMLGGYHFSAQHIVELEKCLANQTSIPTRNLLSAKQNFVIGRALSKHGSSVNLEKGIRCYLEYNNVADPRAPCDVVTFVNHINRVLITPEGIEVLS